ncbi:MAG: hypothetical protein PHU04_01895 [Candidatus Peribacteraceae bacterium]|nr:hypothetical protein [Candidatus Peribacteraceae bacterium]
MARKRNEIGGISYDSAAAYASIPENRERILAHAADLHANLGSAFARRHLACSKITWEEFQAYLATRNGNGERRHSDALPSLQERLATSIMDILPVRIHEPLFSKGILIVADLHGKPDSFLRTISCIAAGTVRLINTILLEKLSLRRNPDGTLEDCNGA